MKKQKTNNNSRLDRLSGFRVYEIGSNSKEIPDYVRKDFYKICFTDGEFILKYKSENFINTGNLLFIGCPSIPYFCQALSEYKGYACIFTQEFLKKNDALFIIKYFNKMSHPPILNLEYDQSEYLKSIFRRMICEKKQNPIQRAEVIISFMKVIFYFIDNK